MKKGYNIIIWCLMILMAVYCSVYWIVNRNDIEALNETEILAEENSNTLDKESESIDNMPDQEGFVNIFAEVYSNGNAGKQNIKLFVNGKNGYFFLHIVPSIILG